MRCASRGGMRSDFSAPKFWATKVEKAVAEVLHRHVGEGVDLDCGSKGCHDDSAEAVDQSLDHQDTEVHNRLLQAGQQRKVENPAERFAAASAVVFFWSEIRETQQGVEQDADPGDELREDGRKSRAADTEPEHDDEAEVQRDVQDR